jgi:hypothetical protein
VVGNLNVAYKEERMMSFIWGPNSYGDAKPMFEIRTTNGVEGENNALLHNDLQHQTRYGAILTFVEKCSERWVTMDEYNRKQLAENVSIYAKANEKIKEERSLIGHQVWECTSGSRVYNVTRSGRTTLVDLEQKLCSRCKVRQQRCLPCRHIISVIHKISKTEKTSYKIMDFIHLAYKVAEVQNCILQQKFVIPSTYNMLPHPSEINIKPPPRYNVKNPEQL